MAADPQADDAPYWPSTGWAPSSANFCEADYAHSPFVAELANTVSSLPIVAAGAYLLCVGARERWGARFHALSAAVLVTGLGSVAFHATLLFAGQLLDEMGMVLTVAAFIVCMAVEAETGAVGRRRRRRQRCRNGWRRVAVPLAAALYCVALFASYVLLAAAVHEFFVATFIAIVLLALVRAHRNLSRVRDASGALLRMYWSVVYTVGVAFIIFWLPDRLLCAQTAPLHLHACWHLLGILPPWWLLAALVAQTHAERLQRRLGRVTDLETGRTAWEPPPPKGPAEDDDPDDGGAGAACGGSDEDEDEDEGDWEMHGKPRAPRLEWRGCGCVRFPVVRLVAVK